MTLLAPAVVEAILEGTQPEGMTLPGLMEGVAVEWDEQCAYATMNEKRRAVARRPFGAPKGAC